MRDNHVGLCGKPLMEGEPHFTADFRERLASLFESEMLAMPADVPHDLAASLLVSSFCQAVAW